MFRVPRRRRTTALKYSVAPATWSRASQKSATPYFGAAFAGAYGSGADAAERL